MSTAKKIWIGVIFVILLIAIYILYSYLIIQDNAQNIFNLLTLLGVYVSAYGLIVAILQVFALRNITQSTNAAINETKSQIQQILSISDMSKIIAFLRMVQDYVNDKKYDLAKVRLCDVKDFLTRIEYIENLEFDKTNFKRLKNRIDINLNSLDKQRLSESTIIDDVIFCQDMEELVSMLNHLDNQLKSK